MADPLIEALIRAQIAAADAVVVSRADLVDAAPIIAALSAFGPAVVRPGPLAPTDVEALIRDLFAASGHAERPTDGPDLTTDLTTDLTPAFIAWDYAGAATFRHNLAEDIAAKRPPGLYRLSGTVRTDRGGMVIDLTGKVRETRPSDDPVETRLNAWARRDKTSRTDLDFWFSEHAAASAHRAGLHLHFNQIGAVRPQTARQCGIQAACVQDLLGLDAVPLGQGHPIQRRAVQ